MSANLRKKSFKLFKTPKKIIPGPILGQDRPEKNSAKCLFEALGTKLLGCFPSGYFVLLGFRVCFELLKQVISPFRKCTGYCGMNMSTNMALKTRTWCYSSDQALRKCKGFLVLIWSTEIALYFRTEWYLPCYCCTAAVCETSCPPQQQREQGLPAAVPGLATRSYTAATAGVAVRCCCCLWPLGGGYTNLVEGHTSRLRSKQALAPTVSQWHSADSEKHN